MGDDAGTAIGAWAASAASTDLPPAARAFLASRLGPISPRPRVPLGGIVLPASRLAPQALRSLEALVGAEHVETGHGARLRHAAGSSLTDYVHVRDGLLQRAPDAVVHPATHDEVLRVLQSCADGGIAVVPFGGGTSVVGGVDPAAGPLGAVVALAMDRMADLIDVDEVSLTATVQPGITGPVLERLLQARGLHWGHLPQSWERATVGGYAATRSAGQASTGYGRSDESVVALTVATPEGTVRLGRAPKSAAGPDLRQLFIGSEGALGVITELVLRVRRLPTYRRYEGLFLPGFDAGVAAFRALAQADLTATVMRLSDASETEVTMAMSGPGGRAGQLLQRYLRMRGIGDGGCLAILGWEGVSPRAAQARRDAAWVALKRFGAVPLGAGAGASWRKHRFEGPYLRDTLLDSGCIVETVETAGSWSSIHRMHQEVGGALREALAGPGFEPIVFCHVSHVYGDGASLYFTAVAPAARDRAGQWAAAKRAAGDAIMAAGGTITHHHAVGTDHLPWLAQEVGPLGVAVLRGVKSVVDPAGVLNPGKLIP